MRESIRFLGRFWRGQTGAAAAEYALLLALIAAGLAVSAGLLGTAISDALNESATCIEQGPDCDDETFE